MNNGVWTSTQLRFVAAGTVGAVSFAATYLLELDLRILVSYDLGMSVYLGLLLMRLCSADGPATRELAAQKETSNRVVLALAGLLSGLSLIGIGLMLHQSKTWTPTESSIHLGLSLLAVFLSWTLLHVMFAIHYARMYYDTTPPEGEPNDRPPLEFPVDELPDFWDFLYFSFTLAVCYQVSDITVRSRHFRRVVLAHVLLSFLNVTLILGLVVEIVSTFANPGTR